ncbi:MAG: hypothetical protein ABI592_08320 [Acidobacteriota bacterium]
MRRRPAIAVVALVLGLASVVPAASLLAVEPPPVSVDVSWYKLTDISQSTDPAFSATFGGALVSGFNGLTILVNGQPAPGSFASIKWAQIPSLRPEVQICLDRAMGAANLMETQAASGNPGGRNTQFRIRLTGAITVNSGNTRVNPGDWTILEVSSFRTIVCAASTFIP